MRVGNVVCLFSLGLSKNYYVSLVIRLLHGLIDGGLGVSKTIMADLCTDSNITIGTGMIFVGAAVGGYVLIHSDNIALLALFLEAICQRRKPFNHSSSGFRF